MAGKRERCGKKNATTVSGKKNVQAVSITSRWKKTSMRKGGEFPGEGGIAENRESACRQHGVTRSLSWMTIKFRKNREESYRGTSVKGNVGQVESGGSNKDGESR